MNADPYPPCPLHLTGKCTRGRLDLPRRYAFRFERFETEMTECKLNTRRRNSFDAALVRFAEFGAHWLQHGWVLSLLFLLHLSQGASRRGRPASLSTSFLSCAIGSCSMISPLKIQTLTPQVP